MGTDGFCPFKDNKLLSLWPIIIILMNLPDTQRYDPRNIIIMYVATSIEGGQPKNFNAHLEHVVKELLAGAVGSSCTLETCEPLSTWSRLSFRATV